MAYLVLVRHGESEWNAKGLWTGWNDIPLSDVGREEAKKSAAEIKDIPLDVAFTTDLKRASETLEIIKKELGKEDLPTTIAPELKEKSYGDLAGKNKWEVQKEFGEEQFMNWRRAWNSPIPNGETLKDVYNRVVPYYNSHILPLLKEGKNVIIAAHGNSIRALIKELEHISDAAIAQVEFPTGTVFILELDNNGTIIKKTERKVSSRT
jgi:2,3-bisphosphoglycerate-dependent phosphoglycerate mutase